jgi:hypothetical protein
MPKNQYFVEAEWLNTYVKIIPLLFSFGGAFLATFLYTQGFSILFGIKEIFIGRRLYTFLNRK